MDITIIGALLLRAIGFVSCVVLFPASAIGFIFKCAFVIAFVFSACSFLFTPEQQVGLLLELFFSEGSFLNVIPDIRTASFNFFIGIALGLEVCAQVVAAYLAARWIVCSALKRLPVDEGEQLLVMRFAELVFGGVLLLASVLTDFLSSFFVILNKSLQPIPPMLERELFSSTAAQSDIVAASIMKLFQEGFQLAFTLSVSVFVGVLLVTTILYIAHRTIGSVANAALESGMRMVVVLCIVIFSFYSMVTQIQIEITKGSSTILSESGILNRVTHHLAVR